MKISPAPVTTPLSDGRGISISWREFFKNAGDMLIAMLRPRFPNAVSAGVVGDATFSIVGRIVFIEYTGSGATVSGLPSAQASYLTAKSGTVFSIQGTEISFPGPCKGWYFSDGGF